MRNALIGVLFGLLSQWTLPDALAGAMYTTTDLGANYNVLSGSDGRDYGVTGSAGGIIYAFDRIPPTQINIQSYSEYDNSNQVLTLQNGSYQVGYGRSTGKSGVFTYASFTGYNGGWYQAYAPIIADMNTSGQVVGSSIYAHGMGTYAAFSGLGVRSHIPNSDSAVVDNLNNYIASIPGVTLTSAMAIDEMGRIIAEGSNGEAYLLTPTALGEPAVVPEPSTFLLIGMAMLILAARHSFLQIKH